MWRKWFPWRLVVRYGARAQGFLDPVKLLTQIERFGQPSEVLAPTELLRAGATLHARGLINSQTIQHNLDWVWPYWVERQFDPQDVSFVPRAFNLTHINLTHRNWTALGMPDVSELPLVDPRGLVTPRFDGWSLDAWVVNEKGLELIPCRLPTVMQKALYEDGWAVQTRAWHHGLRLTSLAQAAWEDGRPVCRMDMEGFSDEKGWLAVSLRPYNPEGISFIHSIEMLPGNRGWKVNRCHAVEFGEPAERHGFSYYRRGDVHRFLRDLGGGEKMECHVGLATAAVLFRLEPCRSRSVSVRVALDGEKPDKHTTPVTWAAALSGHCGLNINHRLFQFLYDAALRTFVLHSPSEVFPGPYTYKRFWFRDAAFILHAMLGAGLAARVERALGHFKSRQTRQGYFLSQEGEWDSNGQALWILRRFCEMTGQKPKEEWRRLILRAGFWIEKKRLPDDLSQKHAGLLPAGFSAEHLGPNDYYYWDDFWGVAGLRAAAYLAGLLEEKTAALNFHHYADAFFHSLRQSLDAAADRLGIEAIPASPYRRMDAGAIGSLAISYPLRLCAPDDPALLNTVEFLMQKSFVNGGFFQEISHSGVNPYLSLHVAQALLRAGDMRFMEVMRAIAGMAQATGQWPEAVHPRTRGGCMGDGQHVWAAAEWANLVRNCFVREEDSPERLVLCQGVTPEWYEGGEASFGVAPTSYGKISVRVRSKEEGVSVLWDASWFGPPPTIEVRLPGFSPVTARPGEVSVNLGLLSPPVKKFPPGAEQAAKGGAG